MKRLICSFLCFVFLLGIAAPCIADFGKIDTVEIDSASDLEKLAKKCTLDSWSEGKVVLLSKDIDLKDSKFKSIPSFGGTFDGQGHKITGFKIKKDGSYEGFFRYVTQSATVKNLNLEADVKPGGSATRVGGIAGSNEGTITGCSFTGNVKGNSYVGAIAGINTYNGTISDCSSSGKIYAEHYTGGIAGQNLGTVISCTNLAEVNNAASDVSFDIDKLDLDDIISTQNTVDITDIGGIAGFSSGIIQSCKNEGIVGYAHIGYNVGGIAGRQTGYLSGCENTGKVFGRKDVGGIVGQMEPYTSMRFSQNTLDSISTELSKLQKMLNNIINKTDSNRSEITSKLKEAKTNADKAVSSLDVLSDKTADMLNDGIDGVNNLSARLTETIDKVCDALDTSDDISDAMSDFTDSVRDIIQIVDDTVDSVDDDELDDALDELETATHKLKVASTQLASAMNSLKRFVSDVQSIADAASDVNDALGDFGDALSDMSDALKSAGSAALGMAKQFASGNSELDEYFEALSTALSSAAAAFQNAAGNVSNAKNAFSNLKDSLEDFDLSGLRSSANHLATAFFNMSNAFVNIENSMKSLRKAFDSVDTDKLDDIKTKADEATDSIDDCFDLLGDMTSEISEAFRDFAAEPIIHLDPVDDDYIATLDSLTDSMAGMTDAFDSLGDIVSDDVSSLLSDVRAASDQMFVVLNLMIDKMDEVYDNVFEDELSDKFSDISEDDTKNQTTGKVASCENLGSVEGDVNTGGIVGSMAIEYDFDPEDDIVRNGDKSPNFTFTTRAVVRECSNYGDVTVKKNYGGGIAGRISLGCVILSDGGGYITGTDGSYIGGIAGLNESTVKNCNAKCTLSGQKYIGGIAGKAAHIYDCRSVVFIADGSEYIGAIAGETTGECARNVFVSDTLGGIDSVSYSGIAEETSMEKLTQSANGEIFKTFTATFKVGDKVIKEISYSYGESIAESDLPEIPAKKNRYGAWSPDCFENLTRDITVKAKYHKYISAIESSETRSNELPVVVAEGNFTKDSVLDMKKESSLKAGGFYKNLEAWTVTATDLEDGKSKLHYLPKDADADDVIILVYNNGRLKKAKTETDGSYVVFSAQGGGTTTFAAVKNTFLRSAIMFAIAALVLVAAAFAAAKIKKKKLGAA